MGAAPSRVLALGSPAGLWLIGAMHDVVILSDERLVAALIAAQAGQWSDLPIRALNGGTDNAMFRLGPELAVRLPRRPEAAALLEKEARWLPELQNLPLAVPRVRLAGRRSKQFNWPFTVVDWVEGVEAQDAAIHDWPAEVTRLVRFLKALWKLPVKGAPVAGPDNKRRGVALAEMSSLTLGALHEVSDEIDVSAAREVWLDAMEAAPARKPRWIHGDLKLSNLLARDGRLVAVIDWGLAAVGDPAADIAVAWRWVPEWQTQAFRDALKVDDDAWRRARGWALYGAVIALAYYRDRPEAKALVDDCRCTLGRLGLGTAC